MTIEQKRRLKALIGYPITLFLSVVEIDEREVKITKEHRELFRDRILGKRLSDEDTNRARRRML